MNMTYEEVVDYIVNVPRFNKYIDQKYEANATLLALMKELDNPHRKVKAIHVAGTNGKGSTVQLIKNILVKSGRKVGCFVSPHLVKINERISVWECLDSNTTSTHISDEDFLAAFNSVEEAYHMVKKHDLPSLTFFEYVFAIAAVYFADKDLDYCIYETGLGGRLDATNILLPEITVITSIGLDHMALLGNTVEQIAWEKAGIIKPSVAVVYNTGDAVADEVISSRAKELNCPEINVAKTQYIINDFTSKGIDFSCSNGYYKYQNININSTGIYQVNNALTAIEVCNYLLGVDAPLLENIIVDACNSFFWQGRMERLDDNLVLDGAHNLDAIVQFTKSVQAMCKFQEINILFAVADDKNYKDMIEYLCGNLILGNVYVTSIESDRRVLPEEVAGLFEEATDCQIHYDRNIRTIFSTAYNKAKEDGKILFCVGSLYLIGSIRELYMEEYKDD